MIERRNLSALRFAPLVLALVVPACFPPTVDPGPRIIADFNETYGVDGSTWSAFGAWECNALTTVQTDGGMDDSIQAPSPDGGPPASCMLGPGSNDKGSLVASFALDAATGGRRLTLQVSTRTPQGAPVNLTGFNKLSFQVWLSGSSTMKLPQGTGLDVQLGCSANTNDTSVEQSASITPDFPGWSPVTPPLMLSGFQAKNSLTSPVGACLAVVDSISFVVSFGSTTDPIAGTLRLDNIQIQ